MNNSLSPRATMLLGLYSGSVTNGPELKARVHKISKGRIQLVQGSMYTTAQIFQSEKLLTMTPDRWELTAAGKKEAEATFKGIEDLMTAKPERTATSGKKSGKGKRAGKKAKAAGAGKTKRAAKPAKKARKIDKTRKTSAAKKTKPAPVAHVSTGPAPATA